MYLIMNYLLFFIQYCLLYLRIIDFVDIGNVLFEKRRQLGIESASFVTVYHIFFINVQMIEWNALQVSQRTTSLDFQNIVN